MGNFMSSSLHFVTSLPKDRSCAFCHDDFDHSENQIVAHAGMGDKHPYHAECLKNGYVLKGRPRSDKCLYWPATFDVSEILTPEEKTATKVAEVYELRKDTFLCWSSAACTSFVEAAISSNVDTKWVLLGAGLSVGILAITARIGGVRR